MNIKIFNKNTLKIPIKPTFLLKISPKILKNMSISPNKKTNSSSTTPKTQSTKTFQNPNKSKITTYSNPKHNNSNNNFKMNSQISEEILLNNSKNRVFLKWKTMKILKNTQI